MELTFVDDAVSMTDARKRGHVHIDDLIPRLEQLTNEHVLFTHLSARYPHHKAEAIVQARLPERWKGRVTLLPHRLP